MQQYPYFSCFYRSILRRDLLVSLALAYSCLMAMAGCGQWGADIRPEPTVSTPANTNMSDATATVQQGRVRRILQHMTLEQKLGQLIIVEYIGNDYQKSELQAMIIQQKIGGYLYQPVNHNFDAPNNTIQIANAFTLQAQWDAKIPLLVAIDQEGGLVSKVESFFGPAPGAREMAATGTPQTALAQGVQAARWLKELGINADLAPVVDVQTVQPPQIPLLQDRTFGTDPRTVETYAGAYLHGLQQNGVMGTLKHFPGLGSFSAEQDPHDALYTLESSLAEMQKSELAPYQQLIRQEQPAMIMATDVLVPAIDPTLPAELSPKVIDGVLRHDLGYQGVVITDGLYMGGVSARWSLAQAAVLALQAGVDMVEGPYTLQQVASVVTALKAALQEGQLSMARIDEAVQRILLMKVHYGVISQ